MFSLHGRGRIPGAALAPLFTLILFSSCSKFGRLPASEKGFTDVAFSSGRPRDAKLVGPPQDGGVVVWGISAGGERAFSLILENDSVPASKDKIPNGEWNFYAVGWDDATNNFEGTARCAVATANLQGTSTTVALNLSPASCTSAGFGASGFFTGGSPKPLRFIRCNTLPVSVDGTQNCDGSAAVGDFNSFKVSLVEHELGTLGTEAAAPSQLESRCFNPAYAGTASMGDSSILLPVGAAAGSPLIYKVTGYTDTGCTAGASTFTFPRGLAASTVTNTFVGPATSFSSVYLVHGPPGTPTGITLVTPASSPGNSASPVVNVTGLASGDTVNVYSDPTCSGSIRGTATSSGPNTNVTLSTTPLSPDGSFNLYAKRTSSQGTSACSASLLTYVVDTAAPTVTSLTPSSSVTNAATYTVSINFSEAVTGFTSGGITVSNGTVTGFTGSGAAYGATITPTPNTQQNISINAAAATDSAGNGNAASGSVSVTHDNIQPTVAISTLQSSPFNGASYSVTITFSESMPSFTQTNISVTNGSKTNFAGGGTTYTVDILPNANTSSTVQVNASATADAAGNPNAASSPNVTIVHDSTQPIVSNVTSSTANGDYYVGDVISIQVSLSESVTVAGGTPTLALNNGGTASYVSGSGTSTLNFSHTVAAGQTSADLDYLNTGAISLNGSTISDTAGNNLNSVLVSPGAAGSLGANKNLNIHGVYLLSVVPAYTGFGNWMKYVRFTTTANPFYAQPTPTACDGSETGAYGRPLGCIHAGELRKVVVTGRTSCANLTASDQNNVFEWKCDDFSGTQAKFFSVRFLPGKGLKHLVGATSWLGNKVTVLDGVTPIGETVNGDSWGWTNPVEALPASSGAIFTIDNTYQGKVLTVNSNQNAKGYIVDSNEIAIVTLPTFEVTYDEVANYNFASSAGCTAGSGTSILFCINGWAWGWYEIAMRGGTASNKVRTAIKIDGMNFGRVHQSTAHDLRAGESTTAFELIGSYRNLFSDLHAWKLGGMGAMTFATSGQNRIERARFSEQDGILNSAFITINDGNSNLFHDLTISHLLQTTASTITSGIRINTGQYNTISKATISNIQAGPTATSATGIYLNTSAANNVVSQVTAFNTGDAGLVLNQADTTVVQYSTFTNNFYNGVYLKGTGVNSNFFRGLAIANTSKGFEAATGITGSGNILKDSASGHNATYAVDLSQGSSYIDVLGYLAVQGTCGVGNTITNADCTHSAISPISVSLASAWTGKVTVDDPQNASDSNGSLAFASITDWANFLPGPRAWGRDGAPDAFPHANLKGVCASGDTCRIWDWTLPGSGPLFNKSHDGTNPNAAFNTGTCPVNGSNTESVQGGTFILKHAIEVVEDDVGNNDGLCESNEVCIHTPHIGAYQGTGNFTAPCSFNSGTLTGITLVEHSTL